MCKKEAEAEIKEIEDLIKLRKSKNKIDFDTCIVGTKSLNTLLEAYKKEQKKNKELENADLTTVYLNGFYDGEKKVTDIIKAKIEEEKLKGTKGQDRYAIKQEYMHKRSSLQEIMKE